MSRYWLEEPIPFCKVLDVGIRSYDEFACSHATLVHMREIGWPPDGRLQVMAESTSGHNVIVKVWPADSLQAILA